MIGGGKEKLSTEGGEHPHVSPSPLQTCQRGSRSPLPLQRLSTGGEVARRESRCMGGWGRGVDHPRPLATPEEAGIGIGRGQEGRRERGKKGERRGEREKAPL